MTGLAGRVGARRAVGLVAALVVLSAGSLSACSGEDDTPSGGLDYRGDVVVDGEQTLTQADALWRQTWPAWGQVITVPDDSRCWFLADEKDGLAPDGLCGPFRGLGTKEPEWVLVSLDASVVETGKVRLAPGAIRPYDEALDYGSRRLVLADGTEGDRDQKVAEPEGWPKVLPTGQSETQPTRQFGTRRLLRARVSLLGHDYSLRIFSARGAQFADRSTRVPPRGGRFLDLRFRHFDSDDGFVADEVLRRSALTGEVKIELLVGEKTLRGAYRQPRTNAAGTGPGSAGQPLGPSGFFSVPESEELTVVVRAGRQRYEFTL